MIVDNEHTTAMLLQALLELDGFETVIASNGTQALTQAAESKPDVFLVDYRLDDMNGTDLIRRLRGMSAFAQTPIVMASGLNVDSEARAAGANLFLVKPLEPDQLSIALRQLIG